jgi:flagellar protein FlaG
MEISRVGNGSSLNPIEQKSDIEKINNKNNSVKDKLTNGKQGKEDGNEIKSAVDKANKVLFKNNTHLKFEIHDKTKDVMVKIVNDNTGEVVKEIPPEKMLDMVAKLWEIAGILVDEKR